MSHFGVLSFDGTGHLNSLIALSRRLVSNGHRVTFFHQADLQARVRAAGLNFRRLAYDLSQTQPAASTVRASLPTRQTGLAGLRHKVNRITAEIEMYLSLAPDLLIEEGVDALIIDELVLAGPTVAQVVQLPYFFVSTSVPHNLGWHVPRSMSHCANPTSLWDKLERSLLQVSVFRLRGPVRWRFDRYRRRLGLDTLAQMQKRLPPLAHLVTLPRCLDFPQPSLPATFHYTGPFFDQAARPIVDFPWERLDNRPLIYVSLGTARKIRSTLFKIIAEACEGLGVQVVISLGGSRAPETLGDLAGDPIVVKEAPQPELIKRSLLVISHAGINTVLECLMEGKPMITIPIAHDQPALAARLAWLGVAEVIPEKKLSTALLRRAVETLVSNDSYRDRAVELQKEIISVRSLDRAVEVIETALHAHESSASPTLATLVMV
jgi:zeaxanthin glucosyltransferase